MHQNIVRILIIDDDEDDFFITSELINRITPNRFKIDWCYRYKDAKELILSRQYDIYFIDYYLGAKTGLDLIRECTSDSKLDEPLVLLTGKGNPSIDLESMQAGAMDYLVKSELTEEKLDRCIRYSLERAKSLKALKANERRYRSIFEQAKDCVFIADHELLLKDINDAGCALFNLTREGLLNHTLYEFLPDSELELIKSKIQETGAIHGVELEINTSDETTKDCILSLSTETDFSGEKYLLGVIHDITQRKRAQKATLQAEKLAATGRLIRTLAHEVRNPLNNINLSLEQIQLKEDDENQIYLDIIQRNSKRIGDIITELLNSSRPIEAEMTKICLQELMDESIQNAIDRLTLKKASLKVKYAGEPLYIDADASKLKIAFDNIIINAIEALKENSDEPCMLEINIFRKEDRNVVQIKDNGIGMSKEHLANLFEPYFTFKRNGMGLGLASSLNILQVHKAHVEVDSAINKGTTFTLSFPEYNEFGN